MRSEGRIKIKRAVALSYKLGCSAPKVVAIGRGPVAEKIIEKARQNGVPVYVDEELSFLLSFSKLGSEIPRELYEVVAKILVFVSNVDKTYKGTYRR